MPNVADLLSRESETVDLEPGNFDRLLRRRDRKRRNQRIGAGALAVVVSLFAMAVLLSAYRSERLPADRSIEPSPSTERVGFVGLPPEGARASSPRAARWCSVPTDLEPKASGSICMCMPMER